MRPRQGLTTSKRVGGAAKLSTSGVPQLTLVAERKDSE